MQQSIPAVRRHSAPRPVGRLRVAVHCLVWSVVTAAIFAQTLPDGSNTPLYFGSPEEALVTAGRLVDQQDWETLSRYYDLTLTPQVTRTDLRDGSFFLDAKVNPTGPQASKRWRQPFPPGSQFVEARAVGDAGQIPVVWTLTTVRIMDQGGGLVQRLVRETKLVRTELGFQFLPPAPTETRTPEPPSVASDEAWQAKGADPILLFRPSLRVRAEREVPAGRLSNLPDLVKAIAQLRPLAAAHPGNSRPGTPPLGEPASVYSPTDDELLLSLAGDRIWRNLQLAPPGALEDIRRRNPDWKPESIEYPHVEIVRVDVAGSGPHAFALFPESRRLGLGGSVP